MKERPGGDAREESCLFLLQSVLSETQTKMMNPRKTNFWKQDTSKWEHLKNKREILYIKIWRQHSPNGLDSFFFPQRREEERHKTKKNIF